MDSDASALWVIDSAFELALEVIFSGVGAEVVSIAPEGGGTGAEESRVERVLRVIEGFEGSLSDGVGASSSTGLETSPGLGIVALVSSLGFEASLGGSFGFDLLSLAFWAASWPAWRIARLKGVGTLPGISLGLESVVGVLCSTGALGCEEGLEGVFVVEAEGVLGAPGIGPMFSLSSPYSFHSSISSRSYKFHQLCY